MKHSEIPMTWKEIEELGLEEVSPISRRTKQLKKWNKVWREERPKNVLTIIKT